MIKVGQIYYDKEKHANFVVTVASDGQYGFYTNSIYKSGYVNIHSADWIEINGKLIAEYPTWQEAVNSKEFKGE